MSEYNLNKKVSQIDVAKYADVSRSTVSYILSERNISKFSDETKNKVLEAVKVLGYRVDPFGKGLKTKSAKTIALVLSTITDPSFSMLIKGTEMEAYHKGYSVIIFDREIENIDRIEAIEILLERPLDGIIYAFPDKSDDAVLDLLINKLRIPTVILGSKNENFVVDNVRYDYLNAGRMMAEFLIELGHRKIAFILGDISVNAPAKNQRIKGLESVFKDHGASMEVIVSTQTYNDRSSFYDLREYDRGVAIASELLKKGLNYTAIIGSNDQISVGMMNVLQENNVQIPENISIACFGGNLISEITNPKLTVVEVPNFEIGKKAIEVMVNRLSASNTQWSTNEYVIGCNMIKRNSTSKVM